MNRDTHTQFFASKNARDIAVAANVKWAEENNLHPRAIENYIKKYVGFTKQFMLFISAYEEACDFPPGPGRDMAMRKVWDDTIKYVRSLPVPIE